MWKKSLISLVSLFGVAFMLSSCSAQFPTKIADDASKISGEDKAYYVGDPGPAGLIFYDRGRYTTGLAHNWRYLEAAPDDVSGNYIWSSVAVLANTSTEIGTGQANTDAIIAQGGVPNAAKACADYSKEIGGVTYDDWFLPSKGELHRMYVGLHADGAGNFAAEEYLSSSEASASAPWSLHFGDGTPRQMINKIGLPNPPPLNTPPQPVYLNIRCIRSL